jgi:hypothetical protein
MCTVVQLKGKFDYLLYLFIVLFVIKYGKSLDFIYSFNYTPWWLFARFKKMGTLKTYNGPSFYEVGP